MKIRIKGNSIRIRLTRPEVDRLAITDRIDEVTEFGNSTFTYALVKRNDITDLHADMTGQTITMYVPATIAAGWSDNDVVGYSNTLDTGNGKQLSLLLEKDFKCIDAVVSEDQSDNFDNPLITCE